MGGMGTRRGTGMAFVMTLLLACKLLDPASSAEPGREGLAGDFVLDFGRHKGMKLRQVPRQYLKWLQTAVTDKPLCRDAVQRFCAGTRAPGAAGEPREREVAAEIWLARWGLPRCSLDPAPLLAGVRTHCRHHRKEGHVDLKFKQVRV